MDNVDELYSVESGSAIQFVTEEEPSFPEQLFEAKQSSIQQPTVAIGPYPQTDSYTTTFADATESQQSKSRYHRIGSYGATLRKRDVGNPPQSPLQPQPPQTPAPVRLTGRKHSWWLRCKRFVQQGKLHIQQLPTFIYSSLFGHWWQPPRDAEARELWWEEVYYPHIEPKLVRVWAMQKRLFVALLFVWLLWSAVIYCTETPVEHIEEELQQSEVRLQLARDGAPGVDFTLNSSEFLCSELKTGILNTTLGNSTSMIATSIDLLEPYAEQYMRAEYLQLRCVCAPMFGLRRRHIAVRVGARLVHLYNAEMDTQWRPDNYSPDTEYSIVPERQTKMFPNRTDYVDNLRRNDIRVQFRQTENCAKRAVTLHAEDAYCVQQCLDLFRGVTVYDRARIELENQTVY